MRVWHSCRLYTYKLELSQQGTDTEPEGDTGYIELQSFYVTLPSNGGSETFQVKYYDANQILDPEFMGDWATIQKVSESSENGVAWNGEECVVTTVTYKVTANATTYSRQEKVIFRSYINYYDGGTLYMEKDTFRVNQLAEGSDTLQGTVYAFSNKIVVDAKGYAAGDTIWKEARIAYKDVSIETPQISDSWVRVKKVVDKGSSKEYDYLKYYELEFDENESNVSRIATITFIGSNEDGTQSKAIVTITQLGAVGPNIDDGGKYYNYKGYFKSLDGVLYSVSFISNTSSSAFGDLVLAGDSPVVVSYTENDRLYTPLRTSTCTVKVVSSSYLMELYSGKAQGTQVIIKNEDNGNTEWCGFMQPNLYNQGFSAPIEEIEFEASDCLSTLQYFDYENHFVNGRFMVTFKDIIDDIMDRCKLIKSYYLTQKNYSDSYQSKVMRFINFHISEGNFFSEEDEAWKLNEVLEQICQYMGLVCFQWGDSVYFIDYDMYNSSKSMLGRRWDKADFWNTENYITITNGANKVTKESYKETGGDMSLDDVFNKVSVNCNYYNIENVIPDLFEDDLLTNRFGENAITTISRYGGRGNSVLMNKTFYRVYDHKNINSIFYLPVVNENYHESKVTPTESDFSNRYFFRNYVGGNIIDMVHLTYNEANGKPGESKEFERYLMISQLNRPWCKGVLPYQGQSWETYNFPIMEFKDLPVIYIDNSAEGETERVATTRGTSSSTPNNRQPKATPVPNYLVINAEAAFVADLNGEYIDDNMEKGFGNGSTYGGFTFDQLRDIETSTGEKVPPALCFYLEIPQKGWWNGYGWVDYKTYFEVPLAELKPKDDFFATFKGVTNNVETYLFLGVTGYRIPLPVEMDTTRDMYFAIAMPKRTAHILNSDGGDDTGKGGNGYCFIKSLDMKIVNRNTVLYEDEDTIYENIIDEGNVIDGDEIDLKITSDTYRGFSLSTVSTITAEDKPTTDIKFYNKDMKLVMPEEAIVERYVNQYSTPSIKTNITVDLSFKPYELITDTYWNKDFVITAQEIDYQYGSQRISILEKK